jgi:hypothetical protein
MTKIGSLTFDNHGRLVRECLCWDKDEKEDEKEEEQKEAKGPADEPEEEVTDLTNDERTDETIVNETYITDKGEKLQNPDGTIREQELLMLMKAQTDQGTRRAKPQAYEALLRVWKKLTFKTPPQDSLRLPIETLGYPQQDVKNTLRCTEHWAGPLARDYITTAAHTKRKLPYDTLV